MAFKMSKPSMINISYNKENSGVSPLHKETDPKDKEKARLAGKKAGEMEARGERKQSQPTASQKPKDQSKSKPSKRKDILKEKVERQKKNATKRKLKPKTETVSAIKSKTISRNYKDGSLMEIKGDDEPKASTLKTTKDKKKKTISGAEALKKAREMRSDKKKNKKSSSKDKRKQERADKIMSKL
tara:strand:+ start:12 stop:566 length:555 start_codon:yes stop_codon:yes gene_type:complete